ncbi:cupredoxin domain-containing protein [Streptomyces sp. NPDC088725]|uniref:cupredoxin domain-containing protein n=1 Tax=Streptomyces sp. NPDC088725 TaxID=3365873 RepID=UPI00381FCA18
MLFPFRVRRARFVVILTAASLTAVVGCSSGGGDNSSSSSAVPASTSATPLPSASASSSASPSSKVTSRVTIKDFAFHPAALTVAPGAKITVVNSDTTAHTLTADDKKQFNTGTIAPGKTVTFKAPSKKGTYPYACTIHAFMKGTLTVR